MSYFVYIRTRCEAHVVPRAGYLVLCFGRYALVEGSRAHRGRGLTRRAARQRRSAFELLRGAA